MCFISWSDDSVLPKQMLHDGKKTGAEPEIEAVLILATVSQQQFQPRMQITQDFIFDKLICYSYVQEYVIE